MRVSRCVRGRGANECNSSIPRIRVAREIGLMWQLELSVGAVRGLVAATGIGARRALRSSPADIAIEPGAGQIGAVTGIPYEMAIGRWIVECP